MKLGYYLLVLFFSVTFALAQNEQLAQLYMSRGDYEKALVSYEALFKEKPSNTNYLFALVECHQNLNNLEAAKVLLENQLKKYVNPKFHLELGYNYKLMKNEAEKEKYYQLAIKSIEDNFSNVYQIGYTFEKKYEIDYAILAYKKGKEVNKEANFNYNLALLYGQKGEINLMVEYYLTEAYENNSRLYVIQNQLSIFMSDQDDVSFNDLLRKALISRTQKNQDIFWNQFLSWFYVQNKQYDRAFVQQKAIFKRYPEAFYEIVDLGEFAMADNDPIAEEIFSFVLEQATDAELILYCHHFLMSIQIEQSNAANHTKIQKKFDEIFARFGQNERSLDLMLLQAKFLAFQKKDFEAAQNVFKTIDTFRLNPKELAKVKMLKADIFLHNEKFSQALLLYAQVETDMQGNELSQEANLKLAMTSYYQEDFEWALQQFKVLKSASSQLIANDALEMFLLITDNNQQDTLQLAMKQFAKADLKLYQKNTQEATNLFKKIIAEFPEDDLIDDTYYKLGTLFRKEGQYEEAIGYLLNIINQFEDSVYRDKAYHYLGEIYFLHLNDHNKAKIYFEKIILNHQDSIHFVNAQKRYRTIRGDQTI